MRALLSTLVFALALSCGSPEDASVVRDPGTGQTYAVGDPLDAHECRQFERVIQEVDARISDSLDFYVRRTVVIDTASTENGCLPLSEWSPAPLAPRSQRVVRVIDRPRLRSFEVVAVE